jgi:hypothetical protein
MAKSEAATFTQPGPYEVEEHDAVRDLWRIRTAQGLIIGPIYGRGTAELMAAAPTMLAACKRSLELIKDCGFGGSNTRAEKRMEKYLADVVKLAEGR